MENIDVGLLVLRMTVGLIFLAHGAQKAFGWWKGPGMAGWSATLARMGYRPAHAFAGVAAAIELGGGLLLAAGLLTPLAAGAIVAQTVVIIGRVHWRNGFFNTAGGFEYPLLLGLGAVVIAIAGPGAIAVDQLIGVAIGPERVFALLLASLLAGLIAVTVPVVTERNGTVHQH
jgi:putative oxidoreductase